MTFLSNTHNVCRPVQGPRIALSGVFEIYRQRRALARLDADALCDLGLTRTEALAEANRPIWDIPR